MSSPLDDLIAELEREWTRAGFDTLAPPPSMESAEAAYAAGDVAEGAWREGMHSFGSRWSTWSPRSERPARITAWLRNRVEERGLQLPPADLADVATRIERYVVVWHATRSHIRFGQPYHVWRKPDAQRFDPEETDRLIEQMKSEQRAGGQRSPARANVRRRRVLAALPDLVAGRSTDSRRALATKLGQDLCLPFGTVLRDLAWIRSSGLWPR